MQQLSFACCSIKFVQHDEFRRYHEVGYAVFLQSELPGRGQFASDSLVEESGFEPLVPLTLNQANAGEREEKIAMSPLRRIG